MKLAVKRTYCSNCRRLVRGQEQKLNQNLRILCPKCGGVVWVRDGLFWRYVREGVADGKAGLLRDTGRG